MKLGFCLYKYFPYGGLQRDFLKIAKACFNQGHTIHIFTLSWQGDIPNFCNVHLSPHFKNLSNHNRYQRFSTWLQTKRHHVGIDALIGFNKMPGLDIYYAADPCYLDKVLTTRSWWYRLTPRFKHFASYEKAVFSSESQTEILLISAKQQPLFVQHYQTQSERMHLLPPGISPDRKAPSNKTEIRQAFRKTLTIAEDDFLLLLIGSGFKTKGVDRALNALAALPTALRQKTQLIIIGQDNPNSFIQLSKKLKIDSRVRFLKGRDDIPNFLFSADLLVHPAYHENTGTVILEAIVAGLPVLATDVCGYAHFIEEAGAGKLINSPFDQAAMNQQLVQMLTSLKATSWSTNGIAFGNKADIYDMPACAAKLIEKVLS